MSKLICVPDDGEVEVVECNNEITIGSFIAQRLQTLDDFNTRMRNLYEQHNKPTPNGIACPKCGTELVDSQPNIVLTSYPPQKHTACTKCNYTGTRIC